MTSCKNCKRVVNLNKIWICMHFKIEVEPIPNHICAYFTKRKFKAPTLVVNNDDLHVNDAVDRAIEENDPLIPGWE